MKVRFEFLTLFREKTGTDRTVLDVPAIAGAAAPAGTAAPAVPQAPVSSAAQRPPAPQAPTVIQALQALEEQYASRSVRLVEGGEVRKGVLVFLKDPGGRTTRVLRAGEQRIAGGQSIMLSTAMEGG